MYRKEDFPFQIGLKKARQGFRRWKSDLEIVVRVFSDGFNDYSQGYLLARNSGITDEERAKKFHIFGVYHMFIKNPNLMDKTALLRDSSLVLDPNPVNKAVLAFIKLKHRIDNRSFNNYWSWRFS